MALGHSRRLVPEQPLDFVQVHSSLHQPRRKGVSQIVEVEIRDLCGLQSAAEAPPQVAAVQWADGYNFLLRSPAVDKESEIPVRLVGGKTLFCLSNHDYRSRYLPQIRLVKPGSSRLGQIRIPGWVDYHPIQSFHQ